MRDYAERTGKIKYSSGLCDYVAEGVLHKCDVGDIPCVIGYMSRPYCGSHILEPDTIFICKDGVTKEGNHYFKETIDLRYRKDISVEEEE